MWQKRGEKEEERGNGNVKMGERGDVKDVFKSECECACESGDLVFS